jgi:hypothetical protein
MTLHHRSASRRIALPTRAALAAALALALAAPASAARFVTPLDDALLGWTVRVFAADGTVIDGEVVGVRSRTHGVDRITVADATGVKRRLGPDEIRYLVIAVPGGPPLPEDLADLLARVIRPDYEPSPEPGVLVFEPVAWPKKGLLLQRVNPGFDRRIQVYAVPADTKPGPDSDDVTSYRKTFLYRTLRGDEWRNVYVAVKDGGAPVEVDSQGYESRTFERLFGDCPAVLDRYPRGDRHFRHFADHVLAFDMLCSEG